MHQCAITESVPAIASQRLRSPSAPAPSPLLGQLATIDLRNPNLARCQQECSPFPGSNGRLWIVPQLSCPVCGAWGMGVRIACGSRVRVWASKEEGRDGKRADESTVRRWQPMDQACEETRREGGGETESGRRPPPPQPDSTSPLQPHSPQVSFDFPARGADPCQTLPDHPRYPTTASVSLPYLIFPAPPAPACRLALVHPSLSILGLWCRHVKCRGRARPGS